MPGDRKLPIRIAVVAASSAVPQVELAMGVAHLRAAGMIVDVQSNCASQSFVFAGNDHERAESFFAAAMSADNEVLWCACGGYGAARILPLLDRLTSEHGRPPLKLLVGFSDATALMSFVRQRWGWKTTHAPMVISKTLRFRAGWAHAALDCPRATVGGAVGHMAIALDQRTTATTD